MSEYELAGYFWSALAVLGFLTPFIVALAQEAKKTIEHLHDHDAPPSLTSVPIPSRPSGF